ncbi:ABC transporter substrate-binding protein [Agrobacterium arsenijevicii]|uniref:Leucine-binding protein domain-containing protein n=1 Tax=Agrobacterium arsenijevicii TaxID=1585697 RepID=A0ABR5D0L3_9HYPH|nr:hypothetical protein RP75_25420 [Agrobacterium arsenijevicii]
MRMKLATAIAALSMGAASTTAWAEDKTITIGMAFAQTGWMEAYDGEGANMAQLWIDQTNAAGGVLGSKLKLETADTKTDRVEGAKAAQRLLSDGAKLLIVSADYDYGSPAALQAQKAGVVSVSLGAGDPKMGVIGIGPYAFTSAVAAQLEGATMADWGIAKKGFKKGYELIDENEYSKSVCAGYKWAFSVKGEVVGEDTFKISDAAVNTQITRLSDAIKNSKVDNVMVCFSGTPAASVIRQIRAAGITVPIMSGTSMDGTYWVNSAPGLKDFYVPTSALPQGDKREEVNKITEAYKAKFGSIPATQYPYPIYAWLDLWKKAVEAAGTTDAKPVVAELEKNKDTPTVIGLRTFTPKMHIQTQAPLMITSYADGKQTYLEDWRISSDIPTTVLYRSKK